MEIKPPEFKVDSFNCPICDAFAHMDWKQLFSNPFSYQLYSATCACCKTDSIWRTRLGSEFGGVINHTMIFPLCSINVIAHIDMPEDVKNDFNEAKDIYGLSPKASAALLRLALQKLCKHLGELGENINTDIKSLVKKGILSAGITKAADTIRIVGNNAVHPGEMDDQDIDLVASKLFDLINFIVKKTITEPRELDALYDMTPESKRMGVIQRDKA